MELYCVLLESLQRNNQNEPDSVFPTAIILNIASDKVTIRNIENFDNIIPNGIIVEYNPEEKAIAEIIDGQHRIVGLEQLPNSMKELPIVVFFDLVKEDKAHIFSAINSNQKQVNKSLIYDLFDLANGKSPIKFCHGIVKTLNTDETSPLYSRIKMIGKKMNRNESISQASLIDALISFIGKDENRSFKPNYIFRDFYEADNAVVVYKILYNYFNACKEVFPEEWNNFNEYILTKTTGLGALLKALPLAFEKGLKEHELSFNFFVKLMKSTKINLERENKSLTRKFFGVGESAQKDLSDFIIKSWEIN